MNIHSQNAVPAGASAMVAELVSRYGGLRVLALVLVALARPPARAERIDVSALPEHLRRDIGLLPQAPEPARHWRDIR
jgi:hypothetical protein